MNWAQFQKPQQYIGNEINVIKKSHKGRIPICIAFPDSYDVGMSNLGLRIIYGLLNNYPTIVCERAFLPGLDYQHYLQTTETPLHSLETKRALNQFQLIGFNFSYELNAINLLRMLELSRIPVYSRQRKDIIILGGGIMNPEPLADFVDVFFLGEFEPMAETLNKILCSHSDKASRLNALAQQPGFYVPQFYEVTKNSNRYIMSKKNAYAQLPVKRVFVSDLDTSFYPTQWLTPHTQIVHDRVPIEIARGCPNRCTFCQARAQYFPYRQRSVQTISRLVRQIYKSSGYEDFSLLSLSASDYSQMDELLEDIMPFCQKNKIGLSLPSLRIDDIIAGLYKKIIPLKKTSLTVAVEAADQKLRQQLNKNIDISKLFEAAHLLRSLKISHLKLYLMFGFPDETEEQTMAIISFLKELSRQIRININASINVFIPKPFSIWETASFADEKILEARRARLLAEIIKLRSVKVTISSVNKSLLETIISRADRSFSKVIYNVYRKSLTMAAFSIDSLENQQRNNSRRNEIPWDIWEQAMREENIDYHQFLQFRTENYPWSFIQ